MQPEFNLVDSVDLISNAGNLRKLFDLYCNDLRMAVRFEVEIRGRTLLLSRWNKDPDLSVSYGCGAGFERETCRYAPDDHPILQESASHHRVMSYWFAGLHCVVQSEVDAYHCEHNHVSDHDHSRTNKPSSPTHKKTLSDPLPSLPRNRPPSHHPRPTHRPRPSHAAAFALLTLDDPGDSPTFNPPPRTTDTATLRTHHIGKTVPAACLVEIKTKNGRGPFLSTPEAQMHFSRRNKLYSTQHEKGVFPAGPELTVKDMMGHLRVWERREQDRLREVAGLLRLVREKAGWWERERGVEKLALVCECGGTGWGGGVSVWLCERVGGEGEGGLLPV